MNIDLTESEQVFNAKLGRHLKEFYSVKVGCMKQEDIETIINLVTAYSEAEFNVSRANRESLRVILGKDLECLSEEVIVDNKCRAFDAYVANKYYAKYKNATQRGIEFDLSFTDMKKLLKKTYCDYTGVLLDPNDDKLRPSIERIDENLGYVKGNVALVSVHANNFKSRVLDHGGEESLALTLDELSSMVEFLKSHIKQ